MKKNILTLLMTMIILLSYPLCGVGEAIGHEPVEVEWYRDGYIYPESKTRRGEVLFISINEIEINTSQGREKYRLTPDTLFIKRGQTIDVNRIKEGDKVVLAFDHIYTSEVSTVRIEDEEQHISGVLRGMIELVDENKKEVLIRLPYEYKEGKWISPTTYTIKLKTTGEGLYNGSKKISLKDLKLFKNKEAYIAYDKSYGNLNIRKLTIKKGFSKEYSSPVFNIEYNTGRFIVDNNLLYFNEGTIVIKDNRLVDTLNIDKNREVIVTVDKSLGTDNTALISMTTNLLEDRIDNSKINIYRGKIEDIYDYEIEIGKINYRLDYLKLEEEKWNEIKEPRRFFFSGDTLVYDSELGENIDPSYLTQSRFINLTDIKNQQLRNRVKNNYYKNKQAYFVVREGEYGNELLALNLTPYKHYYGQRVTLNHSAQGEIKEIDYDNKTLTVEKTKTYNTLNSTWENTKDEVLDISKAVVLLNDMPLPLEQIYKIRQGSRAYIIKEKTSSLDEGYIILIED